MKKTGLIWMLVAAAGALHAQKPAPVPVPPNQPAKPVTAIAPMPAKVRFEYQVPDDAAYDRAVRLLQKRAYDEALKLFDDLARGGGPRSEGAAYWQAYSLNKLGKRTEALQTLSEFMKKHPNSRWLNDAKALEIEVRQAQGQNVSPDQQSDEELKLIALASLMSNGSNQPIPTLRKLLQGTSSLMLKEQALFLLARSDSPEAHQLLADYAKGKGNPDLQMAAIAMLGTRGPGSGPALVEIYRQTTEVPVKRRIIESLGMSGSGDQLMQVMKSETDPALKVEAIRALGIRKNSALTPETAKSIYQSEQSKPAKEAVLDALALRRDSKTLTELFREEKQGVWKQAILRRIQLADPKGAQELMISILEK